MQAGKEWRLTNPQATIIKTAKSWQRRNVRWLAWFEVGTMDGISTGAAR